MERLHTCTNYSPDNMGLLDPATSDGRVIFFLPWEKMTIAGTTDTPTEVTAHPIPLEDDINFILSEVRNYLSPEVEGNTTLSMLFSFEKFSNKMLPHLEQKENWKSYKGIIWPAKKNIIWCIAMRLCGLRLKKIPHYFPHSTYTIVAPLCPVLSETRRFLQSWESRRALIGQLSSTWLAEYLKREMEMLRPLPYCDAVSQPDDTKTIKPIINEPFVASGGYIITDYNDLYCLFTWRDTTRRIKRQYKSL